MGNLKKAIISFDKAIKIDDKPIVFLVNKGLVLRLIGDTILANKSFQNAIEIQPDSNNIEHFTYKGIAFYKLGKYKDAIEEVKKGLHIDPDNSYALVILGVAYSLMENNTFCNKTSYIDSWTLMVFLTC